MTALMTRAEVQEAYRAAVARLRETRRNPDSDPYTRRQRLEAELDGVPLPRFDLYGPEYRPPATAPEFFDDAIILWGKQASVEVPVMMAIAIAARESAGAAAGAVKAAKQLDPPAQWNVFMNLERWRKDDDALRTGADRVAAAVLGEWSRLRMPTEDPAPKEPVKRRPRKWDVTESEAMA